MKLWIQISPGSNHPIYLQIVRQIRQAIAKQELSIGEKLPAVRKLASELVVNPNTVARAYVLLEQEGLVATKTGSGTFVSDPKFRATDPGNMNMLTERMDTIITRGINLGICGNDLIAMFKSRAKAFVKTNDSEEKK